MTWEIDPEEVAGAEAYRRDYPDPAKVPHRRINISGFEFWSDGWDKEYGTHLQNVYFTRALCRSEDRLSGFFRGMLVGEIRMEKGARMLASFLKRMGASDEQIDGVLADIRYDADYHAGALPDECYADQDDDGDALTSTPPAPVPLTPR